MAPSLVALVQSAAGTVAVVAAPSLARCCKAEAHHTQSRHLSFSHCQLTCPLPPLLLQPQEGNSLHPSLSAGSSRSNPHVQTTQSSQGSQKGRASRASKGGERRGRRAHATSAQVVASPDVSLSQQVQESQLELAPYVSIYDTTLRDGAQMVGISLSVSDKLNIARLLVELGVEYIEGGWPGSNPKDAEFFQRWSEVEGGACAPARAGPHGTGRTKLAAFGSTRYKNSTCEEDANVQALLASGAEVITLVAKEATRAAQAVANAAPGSVRLGIHTHNDCDLAVANSIAAVRGGAALIQGCINGYGERTGNANLVSAIGALQAKMGYRCVPQESLARLTQIATAVADLAGQPLDASQPFVGSSAFAHKGGIHVAALRKAERAGLVLDRDMAGSVLARIKQMESEGFAFEDASASVDMLIVRRGKHYTQPFRVMEFSVISSNRGDSSREGASGEEAAPRATEDVQGGAFQGDTSGHCNSQAIVKLRIGNENQMTAAEGNGPVDALSHALRSALERHFPQLAGVRLADYRVRLVEPSGARKDSMSTTRVTIDFCDTAANTWTTVGAHSSIVEASFRALVDGLEFGIANCSQDGCVVNK
eukprot:jgi/Mesen1/821/ME000111S10967